MIGLPPWVTVYRKVLVLGAVAVSAGAAGWTMNGWRKGRELAQVQLAHSQAEVRRSVAVTADWVAANKATQDSLTAARELLRQERTRTAARLAAMRAAQPAGPDFACRNEPLPETYLETFRK